MTNENSNSEEGTDDKAEAASPSKPLSPEARRALAEAAERRAKAEAEAEERPKELGGRKGPDPVRYGDWEKDGILSDF